MLKLFNFLTQCFNFLFIYLKCLLKFILFCIKFFYLSIFCLHFNLKLNDIISFFIGYSINHGFMLLLVSYLKLIKLFFNKISDSWDVLKEALLYFLLYFSTKLFSYFRLHLFNCTLNIFLILQILRNDSVLKFHNCLYH